MSTNAQNVVKINPVFAEIYANMPIFVQFFAQVLQKFQFLFSYSLDYCNKVHLISTRCSDIVAAVNACVHTVILQFVVEHQEQRVNTQSI